MLLESRRDTGQGLSSEEAARRKAHYGANIPVSNGGPSDVALLLNQFRSPIILILIFAAGLSFFLGGRTDATIILTIIFISAGLGFSQERSATSAVRALLARVQVTVNVRRDGVEQEIPMTDIVPGDVVILSAGAAVPGDCDLLESRDLFVDEAALTGETYPVEKSAEPMASDLPLSKRTNALFMGTHVVSGRGVAVVVATGVRTEYGRLSTRVAVRRPETEFERGVRHFGYLLLEITLVLVIAIFAVNVALERSVLDSFLFSLALAVGLTPQLLPAIITVNLSHGARHMARRDVVVKRLASIENFGSMDVLCADKTGTLTEGKATLVAAVDLDGRTSERVLLFASLNAGFETGFANPLDEAIRARRAVDRSRYRKLDEQPYDFVRKRLSVLVADGEHHWLITKGAVRSVAAVCEAVEAADGSCRPVDSLLDALERRMAEHAAQGYRTLAVAYRNMDGVDRIGRQDEQGLVFLGLLIFADPPKADAADTLRELHELGIALKVVTGDSRLIAAHVSRAVGMTNPQLLTGPELRQMSDEALRQRVADVDLFAEVEPNQKDRIIHALRAAGHVVGFLGDGINDASALHSADVGISVDRATDVAKDAADIVLMEKDLGVLVDGVQEGRRTFSNTLKYVFMATSANFGNMFSMAGASLLVPFLPLLPKQILLTNMLTDVPEMTIATDRVDSELIAKPRRWDIRFIRRFMLTFGLVSSIFDYLTFAVLLYVLHAHTEVFRTGWFVESVISASFIVLVIRTRGSWLRSRPSPPLLIATLLTGALTLMIPYTPLAPLFGFVALPAGFLLALALIVVLYIATADLAKRWFYGAVGSF